MPNPHTCPYCSRNFKRPEHLRRHCRTHTKEKPFVCSCGAAFTRTDLLRRHEKLAHLGAHEPNDTHSGGSSAATLPGMGPQQASQGGGEFSGLDIAPRIDAMEASEAVYQDPAFIDSMTNFETFVGGLRLPLDFFSFPFSLNVCSDLTTAAGITPLESGIFGNDSQSTDGPFPFSRDLYPNDTTQPRRTLISTMNPLVPLN